MDGKKKVNQESDVFQGAFHARTQLCWTSIWCNLGLQPFSLFPIPGISTGTSATTQWLGKGAVCLKTHSFIPVVLAFIQLSSLLTSLLALGAWGQYSYGWREGQTPWQPHFRLAYATVEQPHIKISLPTNVGGKREPACLRASSPSSSLPTSHTSPLPCSVLIQPICLPNTHLLQCKTI